VSANNVSLSRFSNILSYLHICLHVIYNVYVVDHLSLFMHASAASSCAINILEVKNDTYTSQTVLQTTIVTVPLDWLATECVTSNKGVGRGGAPGHLAEWYWLITAADAVTYSETTHPGIKILI